MKYTKKLKEINKEDTDIAGGKGASLGEMLNSGISVPNGFVVLSSTFDHFVKETDLIQEINSILDSVDHRAIHEVENASESICSLINSREMPLDIQEEITECFKNLSADFVAVRSSATAEDGAENAWAGQLESYLNTKEENLIDNVKRCWASLFTPRAIFYRFEKGLDKSKISVAVVVQKMIQSEVSGIAFSVHPVTEDQNQLIIEAGFGLGEAIVSGSVTPDSYVVEKEPRGILDININEQNRALYRGESGGVEWKDLPKEKAESQVLSKDQILELAELIIKIEDHYGFPCDIEWAYENREFYIVQSRPITTLNMKIEEEDKGNSIEKIAKDKKFNFIYARPFDIQRQEDIIRFASDYFCLKDIIIIPTDKKAWGNYYMETSQMKAMGEKLFKIFLNEDEFQKHINAKSRKEIEKLKKVEEENISKNDLIELYNIRSDIFQSRFSESSITPIIFDSYIVSRLKDMLRKEFEQKKFERIWKIINTPSKLIGIQKLQIEISNLFIENKLYERLDDLTKEHAWLTVYKLGDKPTTKEYFEKLILGKDRREINRKIRMMNKSVEVSLNNLNKALNEIKDLTARHLAYVVNYYITFRTDSADKFREMQYLSNLLIEKIFGFFNKDYPKWSYQEFINLTHEEVLAYLKVNIEPSIEEVKRRMDKDSYHYYINGRFNLISSEKDKNIIDKVTGIAKNDLVEEFKGNIANKGKSRGVVKIVIETKEIDKVNEGDIIVSIMTFPDFIPAMKKANAFITDDGGITCHAAIVARELNKPCIIGTKIATQVLKDGDLVEVDADNGVVNILKRNSQ